jgi:HK97 family phage portal protein
MVALTTWWSYLYNSLTGAGARPKGLQTSIPLAYSAEAASTVTIDSAFQLSAVFACCRMITESIAGMPIYVYNVDKNGVKTQNFDHPVAKLFASGKVNKWQTRGEFLETMTMQQVMQGNCYALKQYNSQKQIIGLMPFMTQDMQVALTDDGEVAYRYQANGADYKDYTGEQVLHVKCMGNGIVGLSPLGYARNSIGIGQAADNAVSRIYSNGAKPSGAD